MPTPHTLPSQAVAALTRLRETARSRSADAPEAKAELAHYVNALVGAGWPMSAVAAPLGVTRQEIHRINKQSSTLPRPARLPKVPALPEPAPEPSAKELRAPQTLTPAEAKRLRELAPLASKVRGVTAEDDPKREASEKFSKLLAEAWIRGVPRTELQKVTGQSPAAMRARLARHGYINRGASERPYKGRQAEFARKRDTCKYGHEFTPENTYEYTRPDGRVVRSCRACHVRRQRESVAARTATSTTCRNGHPLTDENTSEYTRRDGTVVRLCRVCVEQRGAESAAQQRQEVCKRGHEMTPENTYEYHRKDGKVIRTCRRCKTLRQREYEQRHGITSHR
ncbi:hypothetical protein [Wenjunlia tyrosinilytica]|jgi:hypothetical protein|uniref:HNH endonuclease n=1 Tax=Wenjunlia tyrosinilytica TaxID=1544741 RepID=A0A917ZWN7_9ACTN|nr:hypothetical protein [Wenjunlia tyrosinilytica]GGO98060.1 hypothetical protein GCM10012280_61310 [Wenjunlia tyrosinilytica]